MPLKVLQKYTATTRNRFLKKCKNTNLRYKGYTYMIAITVRKLTVFCAFFLMVGCTNLEVGKPINYAKLERLTVGISTMETVKQVFGYPQEIIYPDSRTIYKYRYLKKSTFEENKHAIDFVFNHNQRLIDITINDAINMASTNSKE